MEIRFALLEDLEVGLLADALPRERRPELVVEDLDLLVDQDVGQVDRRVGYRVVDDLVRELVTGAVERVAFEARADLGAHLGHAGKVAHRLGEGVVGVGQDLLAQLLDLGPEMDRLAAQRLLGVVIGERDVELGRLPHPESLEVRLEARDEPLLAEDQRHPLAAAALERLAVTRALERDHRVVAVAGATVLDRGEGTVLVAQLLDDLVDPRIVDRLDLGPEVEIAEVAQLDLRADGDGRREDDGLAFLRLDDVDVGVGDRQDLLLDERCAVGVLDQVLDRLVEDCAGTEHPLEDGSGRLAGPEAGNPGPPGEAPNGVVDGAVQALRGELDLELDGALRRGRGGDVHGPRSIGRDAGRGRRWSRSRRAS